MAIRPFAPPPASRQALASGLTGVAATGGADAVFGGAAAGSRGASGPALRYYTANAGDIADGQPLWECSSYGGWRYLLPENGMPVAAEVADEGGAHQLRVLNESELNREVREVLLSIMERDELAIADYEPRYLTVPALAIAVLWLRTEPDWASFIVSIPRAELRFDRGRLYPIVEFQELIAPMALARVAQPDPEA